MKILKKPKIQPVTCKKCGCVYRPSKSDLRLGLGFTAQDSKEYVDCPICDYRNHVEFRKGEKDESTN